MKWSKWRRRNGPNSPLGWLNFLLVQWFFFRIARSVDTKSGKVMGYGVIIPVVPMTGWIGNYVPSWTKAMVLWKVGRADG